MARPQPGSRRRCSGRSQDRRPGRRPIELSDVAGSAMLKRLLPLVGGLVLLWIVVRRLSRR